MLFFRLLVNSPRFVLQIRKLEAIYNLAGDLARHLPNTSHVQKKVWRMNPPKTREKDRP